MYQAIIARAHVRPHPNADRLQLATVAGHQVVVGLEVREGELGVFFPCDGQLSEQMVFANNLYSKEALAKLGYPYAEGDRTGFFSDKRRVRAQGFRGQKSDGFWCPLSYFAWTGALVDICREPKVGEDEYLLIGAKEGDMFTALNGVEVCCKYETPATKQANASGKIGRRQRENRCFPKHDVTHQYRYVSDTIPENAVMYLTEKLHGTSGRYGLVLDEIELPRWKRVWNHLLGHALPQFPTQGYRYLNGSKNVILEKSSGPGYYGTNDFRYAAIDGLTLHKGEVLYFEIVGSMGGTGQGCRHIMEPQPIKDELKALRMTYGDTMVYRYGTQLGETDFYVYKIIRINEDGIGVDLAWPQVKARCNELGVKHVPELTGPIVFNPLAEWAGLGNFKEVVAQLTEGASTLDGSHIREGVVLRIESVSGIDYIKNKSWTFGVLEGYIKDVDTYVDTEEVA